MVSTIATLSGTNQEVKSSSTLIEYTEMAIAIDAHNLQPNAHSYAKVMLYTKTGFTSTYCYSPFDVFIVVLEASIRS